MEAEADIREAELLRIFRMILGEPEKRSVLQCCDALSLAFEKIINDPSGFNFIDGMMAVHNLYRRVIETIAEQMSSSCPELTQSWTTTALYNLAIGTLTARRDLEAQKSAMH